MTRTELAADALGKWLQCRLSPEDWDWLSASLGEAREDRAFYLRISQVSRVLGKKDLSLNENELRQADDIASGWWPGDWSVDQAARLYLLLEGTEPDRFSYRLNQLCITADVGELIAFYRGLALYPDAGQFVGRATEGVRSNIRAVFEAVAHYNPYPADFFDEGAWNQMVLKALFVDSTLYPIVGLERRANPLLSEMLCNYAHERWAAGRAISPELWRCVGLAPSSGAWKDLERVLDSGDERERQAAVLALRSSDDKGAGEILKGVPELKSGAESGRFSWKTIHDSIT